MSLGRSDIWRLVRLIFSAALKNLLFLVLWTAGILPAKTPRNAHKLLSEQDARGPRKHRYLLG